MKMDPVPVRTAGLAILVLLAIQMMTCLFGKIFWVNLTSSEPVGLYLMEKLDREVRRGDMVFMSIPSEFQIYVYGRQWLPKGWPLLKHIGALPGDLVCYQGSSFRINGVLIGPVYPTDSEGLPLPRIEGCWPVPEGHFLPVAMGVKNSFDGRYMGPVSLSEIKGLARPMLVFELE
jgi:conjugative transfer signal peptidase TraF